MALKTFDPSDIAFTLGGVPIGGYADGSFFTLEFDEDAWVKTVGADGESVRTKSNNNDALATIVLQQTSNSNAALDAIALLDKVSNSGVVPAILKDIGGVTSIFAAEAYIQKRPNIEYSKEVTTREWPIVLIDVQGIIGGN